jgi:hypothetical protein
LFIELVFGFEFGLPLGIIFKKRDLLTHFLLMENIVRSFAFGALILGYRINTGSP